MPKASVGKKGRHLSRDCGINSAHFVQQRRRMRRSARSRPAAEEHPNLPYLSAIRVGSQLLAFRVKGTLNRRVRRKGAIGDFRGMKFRDLIKRRAQSLQKMIPLQRLDQEGRTIAL